MHFQLLAYTKALWGKTIQGCIGSWVFRFTAGLVLNADILLGASTERGPTDDDGGFFYPVLIVTVLALHCILRVVLANELHQLRLVVCATCQIS